MYFTRVSISWDNYNSKISYDEYLTPDRKLRKEAKFSDNSPVTIEDVIWSYETLGTIGHWRYRGLWKKIESIEKTGPRSVKISFK